MVGSLGHRVSAESGKLMPTTQAGSHAKRQAPIKTLDTKAQVHFSGQQNCRPSPARCCWEWQALTAQLCWERKIRISVPTLLAAALPASSLCWPVCAPLCCKKGTRAAASLAFVSMASNSLNLRLQGPKCSILSVTDRLTVKKKRKKKNKKKRLVVWSVSTAYNSWPAG